MPFDETAFVQEIYSVVQRSSADGEFEFGSDRTSEVNYQKIAISIPPNHQAGRIEWPKRAEPDPQKHFGIVRADLLESKADFYEALRKEDEDTVLVQVHGFNTNPSEALYRHAQIRHDYEVTIPTISFIWPSAATVRGYVYDNDSALFARDTLVDLIHDINRYSGKRVVLSAHSLGSFLTMEALRQSALQPGPKVTDRVAGVFLLAPDIDPDVFEAQLSKIDPIPDPFLVFAAKSDPALKISTFIRGTKTRVGQITADEKWSELGIRIVNLSEFSKSASNPHSIASTSEEAILFLVGFFSALFGTSL
ncbi:MAG: alpha/beta hydrolase [Pseudomonadota bacterium]